MNEELSKWVFEFSKCKDELDAYDMIAKLIIFAFDNEKLYNVAVEHVNNCFDYASQLDNKSFS